MTAHPAEMEVATASRPDQRPDPRQPDQDPTRDLPAATALILEDYLPYRLSVLSNTVSRALARLYEQRFGLTVAEWRIMAVLARFGPLSANAVCDRTAMDKVQVSRAVARAVDGGLVDRGIDSVDRRRSVLTLTAKGRGIHDQIVPLAANLQTHLLASLTAEENVQLYDMLARLQARARELHGPLDEE
ncbi:MarR family winged helix-turn-helix transcriptional regulator [Skermanella mucosa]|uniref:MarR family winged helix-turn-helix transcriptional regulator n=1 Tax=Skermanella mucosa TaxID=1789672 RepID=UPI001E4CD84E|nr:MarR family winged helix-turn-helix transcriptional regulator [Skermanella mucosa]UEM22451.1 MarR family winged helix-turn-helix transcriptional regulator [Skermanella mucosa]